jgi:hypothetical protein
LFFRFDLLEAKCRVIYAAHAKRTSSTCDIWTLTDERHNVDGCALATCRSDFCQGTLGYKSRNMYRDMCPSGDGPD